MCHRRGTAAAAGGRLVQSGDGMRKQLAGRDRDARRRCWRREDEMATVEMPSFEKRSAGKLRKIGRRGRRKAGWLAMDLDGSVR